MAGKADAVIDASGVKGGLVVVLGGEVELLAEFGERDGYLVQGLEADRAKVLKARDELRGKGLYGSVTVKHWTGSQLPFADGVVSLVVASGEGQVASDELRRVLAPRGVAVSLATGHLPLVTLRKPVPSEIDEWTHYLHAADNNAVAKDSVVGPPRHLKWTGAPKYSRNHEIDSSVVAVVSAQGRFFYMVDEGPPGFMGKHLPQQWSLVARDAFNGVILWKRPMPEMGWPQWKPVMRDADWAKLVAQRRLIPITLPRRVVAEGDRVFAVLGYHAPLTIMDAATGGAIRIVEGTKGTDEILLHDDMLILSVRPRSRGSLDRKEDTLAVINRSDKKRTNHPGTVMAVDPDSGKILWEVPSPRMLPLSLTAGDERLYFHTGDEVVCVDHKTGKEHWRVPNGNASSFRWNVSHTMVVDDDVLLVGTAKKLEALSAETGKQLWEGKGGRSGFAGANPVNLYVIDGLAWSPAGAKAGSVAEGRDLHTGEVKRTIKLPPYMYTSGHHFRCYRGKATENYLLENKRGIEMIGLGGDDFVKNDWVRGICRYGILPCNGLIYSTPTPCSCYPAAQLTGFNALATGRKTEDKRGKTETLIKGAAFAEALTGEPAASSDWPRFRNNNQRSGLGGTEVSAKLRERWKVVLSGKLTQPVVADGRLFVASVHGHTVHALDAGSGRLLWSFTVDGRVDSPPTYARGMIFLGSANGWLYCLRASDGELAWRYRVAPGDDQIVSYNQLESVWPLRGSALVLNDVVYAAAGRNSYLDDGIFLVGLEAGSGRKLYEAQVKEDQQDPATDKGSAFAIQGAKLDVLASDGTHITMQGAVFDRTLRKASEGADQSLGIYASAGFLDDLAWNRNAWRLGRGAGSLQLNKKNLAGMRHTGQLLVFDDKLVYGVKYFLEHSGQSAVFYPGEDGYKLFAHRIDQIGGGETKPAGKRKTRRKKGEAAASPPGGGWELMLPVRVRGMTKAGEILFVAGAPDVIDQEDPLAALEGRMGAVLKAFSAAEGKELNELKLDSPPVFDGLIAADGRLFMSAMDGSVVCLGE